MILFPFFISAPITTGSLFPKTVAFCGESILVDVSFFPVISLLQQLWRCHTSFFCYLDTYKIGFPRHVFLLYNLHVFGVLHNNHFASAQTSYVNNIVVVLCTNNFFSSWPGFLQWLHLLNFLLHIFCYHSHSSPSSMSTTSSWLIVFLLLWWTSFI